MSVDFSMGDAIAMVVMLGALLIHSMQFGRWAGRIEERVNELDRKVGLIMRRKDRELI